ncbi:MAG: bifunctional serine/threonine-protein kinase/formylglycine-generating enzyme family protein [Byssovorax sp.]
MPPVHADPFGWVGATIDAKYRVDAVAGEGGFGVVYRGHHLGFDEPVAIKVLKLPAAIEGVERERFHQNFLAEGRLLHRLSRAHAGIVQALDVGAAVSPSGIWTPFLVLEWLEGTALDRELSERRARGEHGRSVREAIALLDPAASALAAAHAQGIAHRDIKPANLFLVKVAGAPTLKVLDFGIAKVLGEMADLTRALVETGGSIKAFTPQYGAPEQFHRRYGATGPWTDVFAFALLFVEIVSGKVALDGGDTTQLYILSTDPVQRPTLRAAGVDVGDALEKVLSKALAIEPRERYLDVGAFWDALREAAAHESNAVATTGPSSASQPSGAAIAELATGEYLQAIATGSDDPAPPIGATHKAPVAATRMAPDRPETKAHVTTASPLVGGVEASRAPPRVARRRAIPILIAAGLGAIVTAAIAVRMINTKVTPAGTPLVATLPEREIKPPAPAPAMVRVAAGTFQMGTANGSASEGPVHQVTISRAFDLDRTEVTVGAYATCVDARKCKPAVLHGPFITEALVAKFGGQCAGLDCAHPGVAINCVDQQDAAAYCEFAGKRLPTEAEWEYAARGTDGRVYPWGNDAPTCERSNYAPAAGESCGARPRGPIEVGSLPLGTSPFGAVDLAGNVWEWVADGWDPAFYQRGTSINPRSRGAGKQGVLRGGGWDQASSTLRSTGRLAYDATTGHVGTGFRCARTLE